jgi:hypothetical protein
MPKIGKKNKVAEVRAAWIPAQKKMIAYIAIMRNNEIARWWLNSLFLISWFSCTLADSTKKKRRLNLMDNNELNKLLQQLQNEIKSTQGVDEKGAGLLRDLDEDIHALLEKSEESPELLEQTDVQRLQDAFYHFEATHPQLTMLISRLMETLSNAGI